MRKISSLYSEQIRNFNFDIWQFFLLMDFQIRKMDAI